jgi:hypothetical protein
MLRARETGVEVAGHKYTIRRPTDADVQFAMADASPLDWVKRFVVGWDFTEIDLDSGAAPDPVKFDATLWAAWCEDHPEVWEPLGSAIVAAYRAHVSRVEDAEKK